MKQLCAALMLVLVSAAAQAVIETYEFSSPALEERYRQLSQELRCPKCQNQNIADSNAPISQDLRALLHRQLEEGASDEEILAFMVARYGEFVRYRPAVDERTAVLWYTPVILTLLGFLGLAWHLSRRRRAPRVEDPSAEALAQLRAHLASTDDKDTK